MQGYSMLGKWRGSWEVMIMIMMMQMWKQKAIVGEGRVWRGH